MAKSDPIDILLTQNRWATRNMLETCAGLSSEQFHRKFEMGVGSLRKTLLHLYDAERWWLENWSGRPAEVFEPLPDTTSVGELEDRFRETAGQRNNLLATLGNDDLQRTVTAKPRPDSELTFRLGDTMLQLCGHGTHHRAQAINMLRHRGVETRDLDYILWFRDLGGKA